MRASHLALAMPCVTLQVRSRKVPNPSTADIIATPSEEDPDPRVGLSESRVGAQRTRMHTQCDPRSVGPRPVSSLCIGAWLSAHARVRH